VYNGGIQLTNALGDASAAWSGTQQQVESGFMTSFQFQITPLEQYVQPADGLAFVIQGSPMGANAIGGGGGDIGYAGTPNTATPDTGIPNSLAIEFDTYDNGDPSHNDPNANHIAILSDGTARNQGNHTASLLHVTTGTPDDPGDPGFTLADGMLHTVTITYTPSSANAPGTLTVSVDNLSTATLSTQVDLGSFLGLSGGQAWVGFTGASGANGEYGDIYNWSFGPLVSQ
jgi:hypothetical protein